jgi:hypothetical protein
MVVDFGFPSLPDLLPFAGLLGTGAFGLAIGPQLVRRLRQRAYDRAVGGERLRWVLRLDPRSTGDPDGGRRLVAGLHPGIRRGVSPWASGWPELTLAVTTVGQRARWEIEAPRQLRRLVETAVFAAFPDCELDLLEPVREIAPSASLSVGGSPPEPSVGRTTEPRFGPALVELFARLPAGASARWTLVVRPQPAVAGHDDASPGIGELLLDSILNRPCRPAGSARQLLRAVPVGPSFAASARLEVVGTTRGAARGWLFDAVAAVATLRSVGWRIDAAVGGHGGSINLGAANLAELWGLAGTADEGRAVEVIRSRRLRAPVASGEVGQRPIGLEAGQPVRVPASLFLRHVALIGRTGSGKSTEMVALAADDLAAGRGFTFIDPHGDAVARLLDAVPPDQVDRVHLLELAERDRPRAFNFLELDGADPELVASQFVDTLRDLYLATSGPKQTHYLRMALMTLLTHPPDAAGPWTIADLYRLFVNRAWRADFIGAVADPLLREFWDHEWPLNGRSTREPSVEAVLNKLGGYLSYPSIREIVASPRSSIWPRRIMDEGHVLLVDLSRVGRDHARLFGSMLIGRYYVDALGRQVIPLAERRPHQLYVDEVQNFDTSSLRGIHTEGRKFALGLTLATQYLRSLGLDLQSAIRANVATLALLQPSPEDARLLAEAFTPLTERDLFNLPRFRMAIRTEFDGETRILTTDVLREPPRLGSSAAVRRRSDERDGHAPGADRDG